MAKKEKGAAFDLEESPGPNRILDVGPQIIDLTELVVGGEQFAARGFSMIKTTRNGEECLLRVPIRSVDSDDIDKALPANEPLPPREQVAINKGTPLARGFGLFNTGGFVDHVKTEDPEYKKKLREYRGERGYAFIALGVDLPMKDKDGKEITSVAGRIAGLRAIGIDGHQFLALSRDINNLTQRVEAEEENF